MINSVILEGIKIRSHGEIYRKIPAENILCCCCNFNAELISKSEALEMLKQDALDYIENANLLVNGIANQNTVYRFKLFLSAIDYVQSEMNNYYFREDNPYSELLIDRNSFDKELMSFLSTQPNIKNNLEIICCHRKRGTFFGFKKDDLTLTKTALKLKNFILFEQNKYEFNVLSSNNSSKYFNSVV